jgi:hypothetical protein
MAGGSPRTQRAAGDERTGAARSPSPRGALAAVGQPARSIEAIRSSRLRRRLGAGRWLEKASLSSSFKPFRASFGLALPGLNSPCIQPAAGDILSPRRGYAESRFSA